MLMAFEEGTQHFSCNECGAEHVARWYRNLVREQVRIACKKCGAALFNGKSLREYHKVTLL
jgi:predicted RNA-binding Zn-ribbon protein involved in translation (DUF1610 family)